MKKLTLCVTVCMLMFSIIGNSQVKSPIKNKLSLVYDLTYKVGSLLENENYNVGQVGLKNVIRHSAKEHSFTANYKVLPRLSVSATAGYINNRFFFNNFRLYMDNPEIKIPAANAFSYGVGVNLFFKKGLAPADSHLGFVLKRYSYKLKEGDFANAIYGNYMDEPRPDGKTYTEEGDSKMNVTYFGVKYNYTRMISKTLPIFWNAGVNLLIPVSTTTTFSIIKVTEDPNNYNFDNISQNQEELFQGMRRGNIFKINMGIGYIF